MNIKWLKNDVDQGLEIENKFVNFSCVERNIVEENVKKWKKEEEIRSEQEAFLPIAVAAHAKFLKKILIFQNKFDQLFNLLINKLRN